MPKSKFKKLASEMPDLDGQQEYPESEMDQLFLPGEDEAPPVEEPRRGPKVRKATNIKHRLIKQGERLRKSSGANPKLNDPDKPVYVEMNWGD